MMKHKALTQEIIGAAYRVYNTLGFGFLESIYENSLLIELAKTGLKARGQQPIAVYYHDQIVGDFIADIVVEDTVILELKSVRELVPAHEVQLVNYLTATNIDVGLLINFAHSGVQVRRKVRLLPGSA